MKNVCLFLHVHQPMRLRHFPFTQIGSGSSYFDDQLNEKILHRVAHHSYLPVNRMLLKLIRKNKGKFRISLSVSGTALEQFNRYMPEVMESFRMLTDTGCVEWVAQTYGHSFAAIKSRREFNNQVNRHAAEISSLFGQRPRSFANTCFLYNDHVADMINYLGFENMLIDGNTSTLEWRSPHYRYAAGYDKRLVLLAEDRRLDGDISQRFADTSWGEWPLTANKFTAWINACPPEEQLVNLFLNYELFGEHHQRQTGIFDFLSGIPEGIIGHGSNFITASEVSEKLPAAGSLYKDEGNPGSGDLYNWLGNDMQQDAFDSLYDLENKIRQINDPDIYRDWLYLQASDHFFYMHSQQPEKGHHHPSPYNNPFDAFINFMNVLTDLSIRIDKCIEKQQNVLKWKENTQVRITSLK